MATDFVGTNTDKIDKLVATIIELRTTLRICFTIVGVGFPIMIGLLTFLVVQSFSNASKIDRLNDQITALKADFDKLGDRMNKLERPPK